MEGFNHLASVFAYDTKQNRQDIHDAICDLLQYDKKNKVYLKNGVVARFMGNWEKESAIKGIIAYTVDWNSIGDFVKVINALVKILPDGLVYSTISARTTMVKPDMASIHVTVKGTADLMIRNVSSLNGVVEHGEGFYVYKLDVDGDNVYLSLTDTIDGELTVTSAVALVERCNIMLKSHIEV